MQVSLYLRDEIIKKVDQLARKERRSRSKVVEELVEESLRKTHDTKGWEWMVGAWKDDRSAEEIVGEIYRDRDLNRRSDRVAALPERLAEGVRSSATSSDKKVPRKRVRSLKQKAK